MRYYRSLIKRLRTCSAEERRAVAMELANTGTEDVVTELIKMVEGGKRSWLSWYRLEDQLNGLEALGETRSKKALEYLKRIGSYETSQPREHAVAHWTSGTTVYKGEEVDISFPHAPDKLRHLLSCTHVISGPDEEASPLGSNRVYQRIISAIHKLEASTQDAQSAQ